MRWSINYLMLIIFFKINMTLKLMASKLMLNLSLLKTKKKWIFFLLFYLNKLLKVHEAQEN